MFLHKIWRSIVGTKPVVLFITDSPSCPCSMTLNISQGLNSARNIHIRSTDPASLQSTLPKINGYNKMMIFTHGDGRRLECFYKVKNGQTVDNQYISSQWWNGMGSNNTLLYFHVCYGAKILNSNTILREKFQHWVSYETPVMYFHSSRDVVRNINRRLFEETIHVIERSRNPKALQSGLESVYKSIESELFNLTKSDVNSIPGYTGIIASVGNNIAALKHSN